MATDAIKIGKRGTAVIPAAMRKRYGLEEGALAICEEMRDGVLIRPAVAVPVERYTPQRKAELLLNNATDAADYARAVKAVRALGLDPKKIPHKRP
jgi:AbrB family looped-hinge helix DNA binding protein